MKQDKPGKKSATGSDPLVGGKPLNVSLKKRGRPKDTERRARILEKARDLFLEHGFQVVSVDTIAAAAEVSNRTVFSHFPSKETLLWEIIRHEGEAIRPSFPEQLPKSARAFREGLVHLGIGLVSLLTSPNIVRLGNLMLSEARRHPDMAKTFYQWGPLTTRRSMVQWVMHAKQHGWLAATTPDHAGDHLIALWHGCWSLPQQLGLEGRMSQRRVEAHVVECVELFMRAFKSSKPKKDS